MEWRALEEHFRVAATQEPGPFGEDAIEWDYSRYARGLGLTGEPGAQDLPHRGCAVLALPEARWDAAEKKYRAWAEERGWALWRFSARPTVAVPDPVVYALGVRAAGPDSLVFARAAHPFRPAMGGRPRAEGMSFPLTPGERWLMAADRVRRRMRAEIGMRGLVLFVEEAEWLTPAAFGILTYLLDAHRAWRARMLSRPARVYVVLATAPEREGSVMRMLERFEIKGHTPVARERRKDDKRATGFVPPALRDIEEEYLFGALSAAPVALAEDDVRAVFGSSAIERCRAMADRGLLRLRTEAGQTCYVPNPAPPAEPVHASLRALVAILARYRQRARRGHEHLPLAAASLSLAMGDPLRAAAAVARMPHTAGAVLPLRLYEELDAALERARSRLRADHMSAWFSLAAHQHAYDHARDLADATTDRELRTWKETHRLVQVVLCTGRAHLDSCLPPDFWPRLKSVALAGSFMDAVCVLGELFWRRNHLDTLDIRQRYEFTSDCLARSSQSCPTSGYLAQLARVVRLVIYRCAVYLGIRSNVLVVSGAPGGPGPLRTYLRANQMPAYIASTIMYAEAIAWQPGSDRSFDRSDRLMTGALAATVGHVANMAIATADMINTSRRGGAVLLLRDLVDDLLVLVLRRSPAGDRHCLGRAVQCVVGGRVWLMGANALYLEHGRDNVRGRDAFDEIVVTDALASAGDILGAADRLAVGFARRPQCPFLMTMLIQSHILLSRKARDVGRLAATWDLIERHRAMLPQELQRYLGAALEGSLALCSSAWDEACDHFWRAHGAIGVTFAWTAALKAAAARSAGRSRYVSETIKAWVAAREGGGPSVWRFVRAVCREGDERTSSPLLGNRAALSLEFILPALGVWAGPERDPDEVLRVAFFLKEPVDSVFRPVGRDFVGLAAEWAPGFYDRLRGAVVSKGGDLGVGAPEARAVNAALRTIEEAWKDGHKRSVDDRCSRIVIRCRGSRARQAIAASGRWYDDATTYAQLWDGNGGIRWRGDHDAAVVAYGYAGRVRAKPVATVLKFQMTRRDCDVAEIVVDGGGSPWPLTSGRRRSRGRDETADVFVGASVAAQKVRAMIEAAARCNYPTLILGETGVGKDLVARCIHAASSRRTNALVVAECAATAEGLLESELFGHEKGAFTGAHARHGGYFERADASSLLLDEVDSMPGRMQAALLRVLETGEYRPVGAAATCKSDFRLISAALPRLLTMVDAGQFRQDLFYRISALRIEIPPLRDRDTDSHEIAVAHARTLGYRLTGGALRVIAKYHWPGNVRQLRHGVQAASLHAHDGRIGEAAIADVIAGYRGTVVNGGSEGPGAVDSTWARALRSLERVGRFGAADLAQAAALSRRSAQRHITQLLQDGRIVRVGAGRSTRYRFGPDGGS